MSDITYRPVRASDFEALHALVSDWSVTRQLGGWPWPADPAFTRNRCKPYVGEGFVEAICYNDTLIGILGVTEGSIGYMLAPSHHGRGIMGRAADYALQRAFDDMGLDVIRATTWIDNPASHALLLRRGFEHYQTCYDPSKARKLPVLVRQYRLMRDRWDRLRNPAQ